MPPVINEFKRLDGSIDWKEWRIDIIYRLQIDMENGEEGLTTNELSKLYFNTDDYEHLNFLRQQMQVVREMLQQRSTPLLLLSEYRGQKYGWRWRIAHPQKPEQARGFIVNRTQRFINQHTRLTTYSAIGQATYALEGDDPLLVGIEGVRPNVEQLRSALELPEPGDDEGAGPKAAS